MQDQSLRDASPERFDGPSERFAGPYIRPFHTSLSFPLMALAVGVAVAAVYAYFVLYQSLAPLTHVEAPAPLATAQPPAPKPAPAVSTVPDVLPAASLPSSKLSARSRLCLCKSTIDSSIVCRATNR